MKDKETILKLFELYIDEVYERTDEYEELSAQVLKYEDELYQELTEEQKPKFDKIIELENKLSDVTDKQCWVYAFSLATKLIIEGLREDKKRSNKEG